jgi:hypothetical protein
MPKLVRWKNEAARYLSGTAHAEVIHDLNYSIAITEKLSYGVNLLIAVCAHCIVGLIFFRSFYVDTFECVIPSKHFLPSAIRLYDHDVC